MESREQIAETVSAICRQGELLAGVPDDEDFFEYGVSSLAVIQMQVRIEEVLKVTVPTAVLMARASIYDWIDLYLASVSDSSMSAQLDGNQPAQQDQGVCK